MANEIKFGTSGVDGIVDDLRLSDALVPEYDRIIAETATLPDIEALVYLGSIAQTGSATFRVPLIGIASDMPTATSEGATVSNTALTTTNVSLAVGQYSLQREATTLAMMTSGNGDISPRTFAESVIIGRSNRLVQLVCASAATFSTVVGGGSAADLTLADFLEGRTTLRANSVTGTLAAVFSARQWGDIQADLGLNTGGSLPRDPDAPRILGGQGLGYEGRYLGVDIFVTNHVTVSSGAAKGAMFGRGAIYWADAAPFVDGNDGNQIVLGNSILFERARNQSKAQTAWVGHCWLGVNKGQDDGGITFSSQST